MGDGILRQYGQIVGVDQLRNPVVDLRVDMVGPAGKDDAPFVVLLQEAQDFFSLVPHILTCAGQLIPGRLGGVHHFRDRQLLKLSGEGGSHCLQRTEGHERIAQYHFTPADLIHIVLDVFRVGGDDRAVVVVVGLMKLIPLVKEGGIEDEIHLLADQPGHMAVGQLRGVAFRFAGDGLDSQLIDPAVGGGGEYHPVAQLRKEGEPERIIFVHIQNARNADSAPGRLVGRKRFIGKKPFELIVVKIRHTVFVFGFAQAAFAAVAGNVLAASRKFVDGQPAVVGAAFAFGHTRLKLQIHDLLDTEHGSLITVLIVFSGDQGGAESAHDTGDIGSYGLTARYFLEASQHRVIVKGTALHDDIAAQFRGVGYLDHFEQCVLDHGIGQAGGDIGDGSPLFLGLFYFGIHEHGTAGAKVDGMFGKKGRSGKIINTVI